MTSKASRHLDRVSKLLNQAERAPEGSPEREAFMEKAVALAQANAIDLALARAHQANKEKVEHPEERRVKVGDYHSINDNFRVARVSNNTKWLAELLTEISPPNDVKCLVSRDGAYVYLNGFPSDLDVVERLYASLAVQMVSEADSLIKKGVHKQKQMVRRTKRVENPNYYPGDPDPYYGRKTKEVYDDNEDGTPAYVEKLVGTDGRVWRANFYAGFIARVVGRMWEERRTARKAAGVTDINDESNSTAVALRDKEAELNQHWEEKTKFVRGTYKGAEVTRYDDDGRERGQAAGARASLGREARVDNAQRKEIG
jgi:hypothetical protein